MAPRGKNWRILLMQNFTACLTLVVTTGAFSV